MTKPHEATVSSICWNIIGSTICWTALYQCILKTKYCQQSPEFYCRIVTVIHAVITVALSAVCYWQGPDPYKNPGEENTALQDTTLVISLGYFLYDLAWSLYHQTEPAIMIIHHIMSIVGISTVLFERTSGAEAVAGLMSLEVTNPLLQARWFLRTAGYNRSRAHTVVELLFLVLFLFMRLVCGTALTYSVVTSPRPQRDVKLCTIAIHLISLAFIFYIFRFLKKKYATKKCNDSE